MVEAEAEARKRSGPKIDRSQNTAPNHSVVIQNFFKSGRSLAQLAHSLPPHCSLDPRAPLRSLNHRFREGYFRPIFRVS